MSDSGDPKRPSFSSFWKRNKDKGSAGKKITFVSSGASAGSAAGDDGDSEQAAKDKAQARRAQVRKAQIQHRQRKANYVKQLEMDVASIRDMIVTAEKERRALRFENDNIRLRLNNTLAPAGLPELPNPGTESIFSEFDLDEITMALELDISMGSPVYQISSSSSGHGVPSYAASPRSQALSSAGLPEMTAEQTQQAINFILALEHICWSHFHHIDFQPEAADPSADDTGHTMMASSIALRSAPPEIFQSIAQAQQNLTQKPPREAPVPPDVSWQASGLTLQSLYGLANSLNTSDQDLTPVQAWFELASQYPPSLLLRDDIATQLKQAFVGVVKCVHYGAVMERGAFESIVNRIVVPELANLPAASPPQFGL